MAEIVTYIKSNKSLIETLLPSGVITLWSGAQTNIPSGWALCDGTNGTPDLRDRFVVGAGSTYAVGATGGNASVTLTTTQIPSHNHNGTGGLYGYTTNTLYSSNSGNYFQNITKSTSNVGTLPTLSLTINTANAGGGASHENRPPYYALCYIMKL